jgi:hypothetical protein
MMVCAGTLIVLLLTGAPPPLSGEQQQTPRPYPPRPDTPLALDEFHELCCIPMQ